MDSGLARQGYNPRMSTPREAPAASLATNFCGLNFASPIVLLSGCVGFGEEYTRVEGFSNTDCGAVVLKGTTGKARHGNPAHRVYETPGGMLNAIGLQNPGVDAVLERYAPNVKPEDLVADIEKALGAQG